MYSDLENPVLSKSVSLEKKALLVLEALKKRYAHARPNLTARNPWEWLVATVLSAQCTDERVNRITPFFFMRWDTPEKLTQASVEEIENVIKSAGLYHSKAKNLLAAAVMLRDQFGGSVPKTIQEMTRLPGIARKTANVVLWGGYGINEGFAVDTHVGRISRRLGLSEAKDPQKVEQDLIKIFPQEEWGNLNHRMVIFGREICNARKPLCHCCELSGICPSSGQHPLLEKK